MNLTRYLGICALFSALPAAAPLLAADALALNAAEQSFEEHFEEPYEEDAPPLVTSDRDVERLRNLEGMTLQWIDTGIRGHADITVGENNVWRLTGNQSGENAAYVEVDGVITEIGPDFFELLGTVRILNTPDEGRTCERYDTWRFAVTQNRSYYRLRTFEWCDYLTDYIDIYFAPGLR
jgi:hypothetical protein